MNPSKWFYSEEGTNGEHRADNLDALIPAVARSFLRQKYAEVDPQIPGLLEALSDVGAHECWHKKSTFKEHLFQTYKIMKLWSQPDNLAKCMLFHSAYANSYVNLAVFKAGTERAKVQDMVGLETEELIYKFCIIPRHHLIYDELLLKCKDKELVVPEGGVTVKHIHSGEPVLLDGVDIAQFLVMTMADFADQLYSWQDSMFENENGRLEYSGNNVYSLWPGEVKPGLWMSCISKMGALLKSCNQDSVPLPPVFNHCSSILSESDERRARDLYWEAICHKTEREQHDEAAELLKNAIQSNPYIAEPHIVLAQIHMHKHEFDAAKQHATRALQLLIEWGTCWDKRMTWDTWVAFTRVLLHSVDIRKWPIHPFGMINLGMVAGL